MSKKIEITKDTISYYSDVAQNDPTTTIQFQKVESELDINDGVIKTPHSFQSQSEIPISVQNQTGIVVGHPGEESSSVVEALAYNAGGKIVVLGKSIESSEAATNYYRGQENILQEEYDSNWKATSEYYVGRDTPRNEADDLHLRPMTCEPSYNGCRACVTNCYNCQGGCQTQCNACDDSCDSACTGGCQTCVAGGCYSGCTARCQTCVDSCVTNCYNCNNCNAGCYILQQNEDWTSCQQCVRRTCYSGCQGSCQSCQGSAACHESCHGTTCYSCDACNGCTTQCNTCVNACNTTCVSTQGCSTCDAECVNTYGCSSQDGCTNCNATCQAECQGQVNCHKYVYTAEYRAGALSTTDCGGNYLTWCNSKNGTTCPAYVTPTGCPQECHACVTRYGCDESYWDAVECSVYVGCYSSCMICNASNYTCSTAMCYSQVYKL